MPNKLYKDMSIMQIVTAADKNYLKYLACHLLSLGRYGSVAHPMIITIIHKGIDRNIQQELEKLIPAPHQLCWFEPCLKTLQQIKAPLKFASCSPHYYRLLAPFIFPACSRAIYLDADTLVMEDLFPLWSLNLDGYAIAAVRDYIPCICEAIENWENLHLNPNAPYFNSGVMLIDLNAWRAEKISQQVLTICYKHQDLLLAQKKWPQYDQYGLNVILHGNWKELDKTWNYGTDRSPERANIIHFIGNGKIGLSTCQPVFSRIFHDIFNQLISSSFISQETKINFTQ